jgi:P-type Cu+ transporter
MNTPQTQHSHATVLDVAISGMHCAGCVSRVETALSVIEGVERCDVNLATERARVFGEKLQGHHQDMIEAIDKLGFSATILESSQDKDEQDERADRKSHHDLILSITGAVLTLPMIVQMITMWLGGEAFLSPWLQFGLTFPVQFIVGARFYRPAWLAARALTGNMDLLVVTGTLSAFGLSAYNLWQGTGDLYFEAAASIITLVVFGKWMESRAKLSATAALRSLLRLRPQSVRVVYPDGNLKTIAIEHLEAGDVFALDPGERVPADGRILSGTASVDQSLLTGESMPVTAQAGDLVVGGAMNLDGVLHVEATAVGDDTTLSRIITAVNDVQSSKVPIQRIVDRVAAVFVPVVLGLALITFIGWLIAGASVSAAIINAVSLLVVACPCALGLATPTAITVGTGVAAEHGILIRDLAVLERAHSVDTVVFDKTGTLTNGTPEITSVETEGTISTPELLSIAASIQQHSQHPLAKAILNHAQVTGCKISPVDDFTNVPGKGVGATYHGLPYIAGSLNFIRERGVEASLVETSNHIVVCLARLGQHPEFLGTIYLADTVREDAASAIAALRKAGITSAIISGDLPGPVAQVAASLGIAHYEAQVLPEEKAHEVEALRKEGHVVAMVGDGINDAPALAAADVGIAMVGGTDVANDTASLSLMQNAPGCVADAISISKATYAKIRQNLFWAFGYNVIAIPLAAMGFLSPVIAGAAMALSSVSVVTNSILLKTWKPDR